MSKRFPRRPSNGSVLAYRDVAPETALNRNTITALYRENAVQIDLHALDSLCRLCRCQVGDLLAFVEPEADDAAKPLTRTLLQ